MKIWILTAYIAYEADTIVAVFDSEEKAVARREKMEKQTASYLKRVTATGNWSTKPPHAYTFYRGYTIERHKVQ